MSVGGTLYAQAPTWPYGEPTGRVTDLVITDIVDQTPNTARFTAIGFTPTVGQRVVVTLGWKSNPDRLFAGNIVTVDRVYEGTTDNPRFHVSCIDDTWRLDSQKVIGRYLTTSATDIAIDLMTNWTTGFTSANVAAGLETVDEITFTNASVSAALTQLAKRIGAYWYIDYFNDLHFFLTETGSDPTALTAAHPTLSGFTVARDLSQVVTRVYCEGGGVNAQTEVEVGETILPVEDTAWYDAGGGVVVSGPQRLTYAGIHAGGGGSVVGPGAAPSSAPTLALASGSGLGLGVYQYAYTFVTAAGESLPSSVASVTPTGALTPPTALTANTPTAGAPYVDTGDHDYVVTFVTPIGETLPGAASNTITTTPTDQVVPLSNIPIGPAGVTKRKIYRRFNGTGTYKLVTTINNNTATLFGDGVENLLLGAAAPVADSTAAQQVALSGIALGGTGTTSRKVYRTAVGGSQLKLQQTIANNTATTGVQDATIDGDLGANVPTSDTSGLTQPSGQVNAGSTSLLLASAAPFSATGGWVVLGSQAARYTGVSGNTLTGIPASGIGSLLTTVLYGSQALPSPALTGIPASGAGSIFYAILKGDPVNLLVQYDDVGAQSTLGAMLTDDDGAATDGIREDYLQDRRLSATEALARANAQLSLRSAVEVSIRYQCRDTNTKAGRTISVNLPAPTSVVGDFKIQRVTISQFSMNPDLFPTYTVEASTTRFSFEDLLRMVRS